MINRRVSQVLEAASSTSNFKNQSQARYKMEPISGATYAPWGQRGQRERVKFAIDVDWLFFFLFPLELKKKKCAVQLQPHAKSLSAFP